MLTINAFDFHTAKPLAFTGPVYYGTGALPYTAALRGVELARADGKVRCFQSPMAAQKAIIEERK